MAVSTILASMCLFFERGWSTRTWNIKRTAFNKKRRGTVQELRHGPRVARSKSSKSPSGGVQPPPRGPEGCLVNPIPMHWDIGPWKTQLAICQCTAEVSVQHELSFGEAVVVHQVLCSWRNHGVEVCSFARDCSHAALPSWGRRG